VVRCYQKPKKEGIVNIDSGILQFVKKGQYYEGADEQLQKIQGMWNELFKYDRLLFGLVTLLNGTGYSKGMMSHMMLSNPLTTDKITTELAPYGLSNLFESRMILFNLSRERTPRALKNLLFLTGEEGRKRVNNSRGKKVILDYIFNRDQRSLDWLAVKYKKKVARLVRHALGWQDLYEVLNGNIKTFNKYIGRYSDSDVAYPVIFHLFNKPIPTSNYHYPGIEAYRKVREASSKWDLPTFREFMGSLPHEVALGFRNLYKLDIPLNEIMEKAKMSDRQKLQMESAAKRVGAEVKVDYKSQDIYDLWKSFYFKINSQEFDNLSDIVKAISTKKVDKIDLGECVVVFDVSHSMAGSGERKLHPFLTGLSIISALDNIMLVVYVGGKKLEFPPGKEPLIQSEEGKYKELKHAIVPSGATSLWRGLVEAVLMKPKTIVVISDGYENSIKGMFNHVYRHFKDLGLDFNLIHINPVFAADARTGTTRRIAEDVKPLAVNDYKFLETEVVFSQMIENREAVKTLLLNKYQKMIGGSNGHI